MRPSRTTRRQRSADRPFAGTRYYASNPPQTTSRGTVWRRKQYWLMAGLLAVFALVRLFAGAGQPDETEEAAVDDVAAVQQAKDDTVADAVREKVSVAEPTPASAGRKSISARLLGQLTRMAEFADVAYCVSPPGPGLEEPFTCPSRCSGLGDVRLIKSWSGLGLVGEGRGATTGYVALDMHDLTTTTKQDDGVVAEGSIMVVFRGTNSIVDALSDLALQPQPYEPYDGSSNDTISSKPGVDCSDQRQNCSVHSGFASSWQAARPVVMTALDGLSDNRTVVSDPYRLGGIIVRAPSRKEAGKTELVRVTDIQVVGHSLGAAVACLAGLDLVRSRTVDGFFGQSNRHSAQLPVTVTTFGEPRVGNLPFARYVDRVFDVDIDPNWSNRPGKPHEDQQDGYFRVTHEGDPVPLLPPRLGSSDDGLADDPTALYSAHSHEIFIAPVSGVAVKPEDVRICQGRADSSCSIGHGGQNEAFWGSEGWFWRVAVRKLIGKGRLRDLADNWQMMVEPSTVVETGRVVHETGGMKAEMKTADDLTMDEMVGALGEAEAGVAAWLDHAPAALLNEALVAIHKHDADQSIESTVHSTPESTSNPEVESDDDDDDNDDLVDMVAAAIVQLDTQVRARISGWPKLPVPVWKQLQAHREYFVLLGLCMPSGWKWPMSYMWRFLSPTVHFKMVVSAVGRLF